MVSVPECVEIAERIKEDRRFIILINYLPEHRNSYCTGR